MKCIKCGTDNNLRDRRINSGRCKRCLHRFVFESTTINGVKITDAMFAKAIADISVNDTLFFTSQQLRYFLGKRFKQKIPRVFYTPTKADHYYQCQSCINQWKAINPIAKMLPPPLHTNENANTTVSPDVSAYSFDRLVVCDRPEIAQFLIANNFHFENNCAVLSVTGYPQSIFDTIMQMLRRNPDLKVYAFHDCTPKGIGLVNQLRTIPNWFENSSVIIIDIGLLPRQIIAAGDSRLVLNSWQYARDAVQLPPAIRQDLSPEELDWLKLGKFVELESFSPQKLIQILNRGIAGSRDIGSDDSSFILLGGTDSSIYVVDSFG